MTTSASSSSRLRSVLVISLSAGAVLAGLLTLLLVLVASPEPSALELIGAAVVGFVGVSLTMLAALGTGVTPTRSGRA